MRSLRLARSMTFDSVANSMVTRPAMSLRSSMETSEPLVAFMGAPPGTRTQNLRIKSREETVPASSGKSHGGSDPNVFLGPSHVLSPLEPVCLGRSQSGWTLLGHPHWSARRCSFRPVFSGVLEISSEPKRYLDPLDVARLAPKTELNEVGSMCNRICRCRVDGIAEQPRRFRAPVERPSRRPPLPIRYSTVRTYTSGPRLRTVSR